MPTSFQQFRDLHDGKELFILPNAWNAKSAAIVQEEGFPAVATSSAAVAACLGHADGEELSFSDYFAVIARMCVSVRIPLSVDMEMGYAPTDDGIYDNLMRLAELGVAGVNLEDSAMGPSGRVLKEAATFARTLEYLRGRLVSEKVNLFINVRCDTFLLNVAEKQKETRKRLKIYETSGADGIFLPCIVQEQDILDAVNSTYLPLNVMCVPGLPDWGVLRKLGVKRVSMGPFLFNSVYAVIGRLSREMNASKSFAPILS